MIRRDPDSLFIILSLKGTQGSTSERKQAVKKCENTHTILEGVVDDVVLFLLSSLANGSSHVSLLLSSLFSTGVDFPFFTSDEDDDVDDA